MNQEDYIIGMMSGTSCDGIDVAIMNANNFKLVDFATHPLPHELRSSILHLTKSSFGEIAMLGSLDRALGLAFAQAALETLKSSRISKDRVLAVASHGQTIRHCPDHGDGEYPFTLQIGCAATIAEATGLTVMSDFRRRDIAASGQGAPLVPFAHEQLFPAIHDKTTVIVNIGGIANVTVFSPDKTVEGFDTGPGNMVMDALMLNFSDGRYAYDKGGKLASMGHVCQTLLDTLLQHPFLQQPPPKSTGREAFGEAIVDDIIAWHGISDADRMATACAFTAQSIAMSRLWLHSLPEQWFVCGGGAFNACLVNMLQACLAPASLGTSADQGIPVDAVEALSFALLSTYTLLGKTNTLHGVTGAKHDVCGGQITPGANWPYLLQWIQQQA